MKIVYRIVHGLIIAWITYMLIVVCSDELVAMLYLAFMIGVAIERLGENNK